MVRRPSRPAQPGSRATPASTRILFTWMRPRQGPKPWSLTIITAALRRSASSQRRPIASSSPRITPAAASFQSGSSMPVSSTFRYRQTRCWNGSRFWNWTIRADQSGTIRSASKPPSARPRKLSAVRRALDLSSSSDPRGALPEVAEGVAGGLGRAAARRTPAPPRGRRRGGGRPSPRRRCRGP